MDSIEYIKSQLDDVLTGSHNETTYRIKVNGASQDTKWISIDRTTLLKIYNALIGA